MPVVRSSKGNEMSYDEMCTEILADPDSSNWLRNAMVELNRRDPVDAERDAETIANLQSARVSELLVNA